MSRSYEKPSPHLRLLLEPVPNMKESFERKRRYSDLPIDTTHELFDEPLVAIGDYNLAGRAYYSLPNSATGDAVEGIEPMPYVRKSISETLAAINDSLRSRDVVELFSGDVELYIKEGLRPVWLQQHLYEEVMPRRIAAQNVDMTERDVLARRDELIAKPSGDPHCPSPHATGGAFDLTLRYTSGHEVDMGHVDGDTLCVSPDYYEIHAPTTAAEQHYRDYRRAFYTIMTVGVSGEPTGFVVNPTEWWHYGRGDQLSEKVRGSASAYYSSAG